MPRVPDNTISDAGVAKVARRNAFSISPSAFPSLGGPLSQAARAMDAAIALEGRRGRRALDEGRDNRNRHLQHARDWEAAMGAAAKATDQWNRVMEHRADDEATRRLTEAEKAMTAGTMGQLSPTGDPTGGAFNTPYVPGDPEGNQPGQGASSETGKLAAKVREAAYDGASGRVRYRLDRKFDGVVAPYLRKAQQIDFAAAKKLELDTRMTDAAQAADGFIALNSGLETAHGVTTEAAMQGGAGWQTTLDLGEAVGNAAQKQAVAAMLKAGYRPVNNDFDNPQYAGEAQKMYEKMAGDAKAELSVRLAQSHAQAMVAEDDDTFAAERKGICEFIADGLQDAGNTEAAEKTRKIVEAAEKARDARFRSMVNEADTYVYDIARSGDAKARAEWDSRVSALPDKYKSVCRDNLSKEVAWHSKNKTVYNFEEARRNLSPIEQLKLQGEYLKEGGVIDAAFPDRANDPHQRTQWLQTRHSIMGAVSGTALSAVDKQARAAALEELRFEAQSGFSLADLETVAPAATQEKIEAAVEEGLITDAQANTLMNAKDNRVELPAESYEKISAVLKKTFGFGSSFDKMQWRNGSLRATGGKKAPTEFRASDVERTESGRDHWYGRDYRITADAVTKMADLCVQYLKLEEQGHLQGATNMEDWVREKFSASIEGKNFDAMKVMETYEAVESELSRARAASGKRIIDKGRKAQGEDEE